MRIPMVSRVLSLALVVLCPPACAAKATAKVPPVRAEAERVARTFWESHLSKCGETYVVSQLSKTQVIPGGSAKAPLRIVQMVGVKFFEAEEPLNDADRLNGVEWNGYFSVTASARRDYVPKSVESGFPPNWSWSAWGADVTKPRRGIYYFRVTKTGGKWLADNGSSGYGPVWEAIESFNLDLSPGPCDLFPSR